MAGMEEGLYILDFCPLRIEINMSNICKIVKIKNEMSWFYVSGWIILRFTDIDELVKTLDPQNK